MPTTSSTDQQPEGDIHYPSEQSVDIVLRDGSTVHFRPVVPADREAILRFLNGMSDESLYMRGCGIPNLERLSSWSVDVDYAGSYGVLVTHGQDHEVVGHGAYVRTSDNTAEVAFEVADSLHGFGIATLLLGHLAGVASRHGIGEFTAEVMTSNHKMLAAFQSSGFPVSQQQDGALTEVRMPTVISAETRSAFEHRSHVAAVAAVRHVLAPESIAVIGASERRRALGTEVMRNLVLSGYAGRVYPVNPRHRTTYGITTYASIKEVPEAVDLALVAVSAAKVPGLARECADAGVHALNVLCSGFADGGEQGHALQSALLGVCRDGGIRLVGPASLGVFNGSASLSLNAIATGTLPKPGVIGLMAQSAGMGAALLNATTARGIGLSGFVSVGDKLDISGNDLLEYWEDDAETRVIALYLESFGNPRRFARIARRVSAKKPVLAVKSGKVPSDRAMRTTAPGATGGATSLIRTMAAEVTVDALFRQAGVIRADTIGELLDTAALLQAQRAPAGMRVAVVSNGHGAAQATVDACAAAGLEIPALSARTQARLASVLTDSASSANPVDRTRSGSASDYRATINLLTSSGECDSVLAVLVPAPDADARKVAAAIDAAAGHARGVTVAVALMDAAARVRPPRESTATSFGSPEAAARSLAAAARWSLWRTRTEQQPRPLTGLRGEEARVIVARALAGGDHLMPPAQATALMSCYGINIVGGSGQPTLAIGVTHDDTFGPIVVCGPADPCLWRRGSVSAGIAPLTAADIDEIVRSLPGIGRFDDGSAKPAGMTMIENLLQRISALVEAHPDVAEIELPSVAVTAEGIELRHPRVELRPAPSSHPIGWLKP